MAATHRKVIITCAVTGAIHTPSMSPHLPVTSQQIADSALAAHGAGAAIVHLHARNPQDGRPTQDPGHFVAFLGRMRRMRRTADRLFGHGYVWSVLGAGRNQMRVGALGAALDGNVRVGLEDSLWIAPGRLAESNRSQVEKIRGILEALSLEIASAAQAREMLDLKGAANVAF